jgi:PrgI family protein
MEFTIPQFIEKEAKIVGPLTFKQFAFFGLAVLVSAALYFILPKIIFFVVGPILIVGAFALAFYKKEGVPLPDLMIGFFSFIFKPKIYLWKKKGVPPRFLRPEEIKKRTIKKEAQEERRGPRLKMSKGSHLHDLFTQVETKE